MLFFLSSLFLAGSMLFMCVRCVPNPLHAVCVWSFDYETIWCGRLNWKLLLELAHFNFTGALFSCSEFFLHVLSSSKTFGEPSACTLSPALYSFLHIKWFWLIFNFSAFSFLFFFILGFFSCVCVFVTHIFYRNFDQILVEFIYRAREAAQRIDSLLLLRFAILN